MPTIRLTTETMTLLRGQMPPGFRFVCLATETDDGSWGVPVNDEVAFRIARKRLSTESDDQVVLRLVQAEIGTQSG